MMKENLENILKLSVTERLYLMDAIWDSLSEEVSHNIPQHHKSILKEREAKYLAGESKPIPWEEAMKIIGPRNERN